MDHKDTVHWLAQVNSASCYPKRFEDVDTSLPYFKIQGQSIDMFNYHTHDNAPRMPYICQYLTKYVLPEVKGLDGYYNIQLHDTYTYLNDNKIYKDVLCFGKAKKDKGPVMLPDCYFLGDWAGKYKSLSDSYKWNDKMDKACFFGTTTGNRDPLLNQRIQTCLWALDKPQCDFKITNVAQIDQKVLLQNIPMFPRIYHTPVSLDQQMKYKYHLIIDGNTRKWDVDVYFTNSLGLMIPSDDMLWYYPILNADTYYVNVTYDDMLSKMKYYSDNGDEAQVITKNANNFAKRMFNSSTSKEYTVALFENIAFNK